MNTARSALSSIMFSCQGDSVGNHKWVKRLMKGVFLEKPSLPRYQVTWDVSKVLDLLKTWALNDLLLLKFLTFKLVMLMGLLSGQRVQTLHLMDIRNIEFRNSVVIIRIGDLIKQSRPGFHIAEITLPAYEKDKNLCVYNTLLQYLKRTRYLRENHSKLLISYRTPFDKISKASVGRWLKETMFLAGVDTGVFGPHSVRSASVSRANLRNVPISTIIRTAGWASECMFRKYYDKPVSDAEIFGRSILN